MTKMQRYHHRQSGNVLAIILLAVALMAALTLSISGDNQGQQHGRLSTERTALLAGELMSHATSAQQALMQMNQFGVGYDELLVDLPTQANYSNNTARQLYNPAGGGLQPYPATNENLYDGQGTTGWSFQTNTNVGWSNTAAVDVIYSFINVNSSICSKINESITGSGTIPSTSLVFAEVFIEGGTDTALTATNCPECEGKSRLCISNGTSNVYYNIIGEQ